MFRYLRLLPLLILLLFLPACQSEPEENTQESNPPAPDFDSEGSDPRAIELADAVMVAIGGRENWDGTRFIKWNFFGSRQLLWDKMERRVRIESERDSSRYILDLNSGEGHVWRRGRAEVDSLDYFLDRARRIWINDSYWLVMPFKLKDSGVTLKYLGEDVSDHGIPSELIEVTFSDVGVTPQNKYKVWIGKESDLVVQWAYFRNADDPDPRIVTPWDDYLKFGDIFLSVSRGPDRAFSEVEVLEYVSPAMFEDIGRDLL
jgi:hypothetical protein